VKTKLNPRIETAHMSYQLIFTPGQMSPVRTERTTKPSLKEMQKAVGGLIELAYEGRVDGLVCQVWVDEEGLLKARPHTNLGLLDWMVSKGIRPRENFVGPALVLVGGKAIS
jgi:hypothetical protein